MCQEFHKLSTIVKYLAPYTHIFMHRNCNNFSQWAWACIVWDTKFLWVFSSNLLCKKWKDRNKQINHQKFSAEFGPSSHLLGLGPSLFTWRLHCLNEHHFTRGWTSVEVVTHFLIWCWLTHCETEKKIYANPWIPVHTSVGMRRPLCKDFA